MGDDDGGRCLTVRQPWAAAIIHGTKRIENRSWKTAYKGRLYIHAGIKLEPHDADGELGALPLEFGAIIGHVQLLGMTTELEPGDEQWARPGRVWWRLADPVALPVPIPHRGMPGLWRVAFNPERASAAGRIA